MIADFESLREMLGGLLAQVCLSALLLIVCGIAIAKLAKATGRPLGELWRKSRALFAALALLACCATLDAQKTNGVFKTGLTRLTGLPGEFSSVPLSQNPVNPVNSVYTTGDDIARGYRQESTTTNDEPFAEMPPNAVEYAQWARRGGRETSFPLDLGGFVFPLGTNRVTRFDVLSGGAVEPLPRGTSAAICAAREYASLVPGVSRFWSADAEDGAKVLRWDRVFANRDRTGEYTAEMRFFQNGDFTTRSNEVETVYRRVNPDDFDGDGIANDIDADPLFCDGDFYGVANALPSNANENAYYRLDLCATGALGVATIRVTCDGPSDLGDHVIIARANRVCHIPLLAGATYAVESDLPIGCSEVSAEYAEIATNSETSLTVALPLELSFERVQARGGADRYIAYTTPIDVGPRMLNVTGGCCSCVTNENGFSWSCSDGCECGGYWHNLSTTATWEGYAHTFDWREWCGCGYREIAATNEIAARGVSLALLDASGNDIEWANPVLVGELVRIRASVGGEGMSVGDFVGLFSGRLWLRCWTVDFDGEHQIAAAAVPVSSATVDDRGMNVFHVTIPGTWLESSGLASNTDDGRIAKTSIDMSDEAEGKSNRQDSDMFDQAMQGELHGRARSTTNASKTASIPEGMFNMRTVQAAGTGCLAATVAGTSSDLVQVQQQADVLYYSGHGWHDSGKLNGIVAPSDVAGHWHDVDTVVFAGCSVLDIGDRGNNYTNQVSHSASPGLRWVSESGASTFLGYCWKAPLDYQGSVGIVRDWCARRATLGDVDAWMRANDNSAGRNACAIRRIDDETLEYRYFKKTAYSLGRFSYKTYELMAEEIKE